MGAIGSLAVGEGRHRWRGWLGIVVAGGLGFGLAIGAAAGARRTDTAFARRMAADHAADAVASVDQSTAGIDVGHEYLARVDRLPQVTDTARIGGVDLAVVKPDGSIDLGLVTGSALGLAAEDDRAFRTVSSLRVVEGRLPAPNRPDEVTINPELSKRSGWRVGTVVRSLKLFRLEDLDQNLEPDPSKGTPLTLKVVGITRVPEDLLTDAANRNIRVFLTAAFSRAYPRATFYETEELKLRRGALDVEAVRTGAAAVAQDFQGIEPAVASISEGLAHIRVALAPQVTALWLFALAVWLATVLLVGQAVSRQLRLGRDSIAVARSLGLARRERVAVSVVQVAAAAVASAVVAVGVALAVSSLAPLGAARAAEPSPGVEGNAAIVGVGALLVLVVLLAVCALPAWRVARDSERGPVDLSEQRPLAVAEALSAVGAGPAQIIGVRLALQPGRGAARTPVRSGLSGLALALALAVAAFGFAGNLQRLSSTPRLFGWTWSAATGNSFGAIPDDAIQPIINQSHVIAAAGETFGTVRIDGRSVPAVGIDQLRGHVFPTLASGRIPRGTGEIVVGTKTLKQLKAKVGGLATLTLDGKPRRLRVVGTAVFPNLGNTRFQETGLGTGVAGAAALFPNSPEAGGTYSFFLLKLSSGGVSQIRRVVAGIGCPEASCVLTDGRPSEISAYARVSRLPLILAGIVAAFLMATLAHLLYSSTRRRRHELAVLKSIGMTRRQISAVVLWQSVTLAVTAVLVGVPLGLIGGRYAWGTFAHRLGVVNSFRPPWPPIAVGIAAVIAASALVSAGVAFSARRTRPASILRLP